MSRRFPPAAVIAAVLSGYLIAGPGELAVADQNDARLDGLFQRLQETRSPAEARTIEQQIWQLWLESGNPAVDRLMAQGIVAMREEHYDDDLRAFDRMVGQAPDFAEGWNKRATVHYLMGDWTASVLDIERTLALEPRHFGALFGLGLIYDALEQPEAALRSYEATLQLNPNSESARARIEELRRQLQGRPT
jgi:tetratricopeptide (TPR) repeat protein